MTTLERRRFFTGVGFASPAIVGLLVFTAYPIAASLYYSFCNYSVLRPPRFIGLTNYQYLFSDELFHTSLFNTVYYAAFAVPMGVVVALILAMLLNTGVRGLSIYRTCFYIPSIVPLVAGSVLWIWLFNPQSGAINDVLRKIGIVNPPGWLADPAWSKPAIVLWSVWGIGGAMVIFLAGLQDAPKELYEAAEVDGATTVEKTFHITLPLLSPHILFVVIIGLIGAFQFFTPVYVMTGGTGGPVDSTMFYSLYLFLTAFSDFKMGYACAMAWILLLIVAAATALVFKTSARYVYYAGKN